jgi:5'-3' exoribonuclease 1
MEPFDLPTLDGLHLIPGLCDGVALGVEAMAGFPSLNTLPHTALLGHHGVNVHGSESRNKSMIIHIKNIYEGKKMEDLARGMVNERTFITWPFLQEGLVVAVSDSLFKYEKMVVTPGSPAKVVSTPHAPNGLGLWKSKAGRIEDYYSKRCGVLTGDVEVLLHVRPLKGLFSVALAWMADECRLLGLKRLESGALVKDYEGLDKELEQAVQMCLPEVASEDPRFLERDAPKLSEEYPEGSKIFFLGEHAYGVAAQVSATTEETLSVILAVRNHGRCLACIYYCTKTCSILSSSLLKRQKSTNSKTSFLIAKLLDTTLLSKLLTLLVSLDERWGKSRQASWLSRPIIKRPIWA